MSDGLRDCSVCSVLNISALCSRNKREMCLFVSFLDPTALAVFLNHLCHVMQIVRRRLPFPGVVGCMHIHAEAGRLLIFVPSLASCSQLLFLP